ncbi:MAG: TIGR04283 family arsenosugar biosynthesis glycosyltransferase [Gammaproteobacteria bacterium]|nr:TIGR04283 family arsenosugar biosynthesis glycosyltransferase [Gammaproteobacteria bacterium]
MAAPSISEIKISVVIPVLNEQVGIVAHLQRLQLLRQRGHEVIVVDGGSDDQTVALASPLADCVLQVGRGRARQMNAGAASASGDVLLFLHADTTLPEQVESELMCALRTHGWGRFDVRLSGSAWVLRLVERMMNWRSRLTGVATGDQAMFVRRPLFVGVRGFPEIPLMEDVALSKTLRRYARPWCSRLRVVTSSRRWEQNGPWRTIWLMWRLRLAYFLGVSPQELAKRYR